MGAWIETFDWSHDNNFTTSHPLWVRGLKLMLALWVASLVWSHPLWVRGLKQAILLLLLTQRLVASFMGAWIETFYHIDSGYDVPPSHPLWVRGLKP